MPPSALLPNTVGDKFIIIILLLLALLLMLVIDNLVDKLLASG